MSFKSIDFKGLKIEFAEILASQYTSSEIKLIWREIMRHYFALSSTEQLMPDQRVFTSEEIELLNQLLQRLDSGEPFQYLLGEVEFYGLELKIDRRVLIPRPETEELVDWINQNHKGELKNILDVCSGSGCIALALSNTFQGARVCGVEYSNSAIELAQENALALKLPVRYIETNVLDSKTFRHSLAEEVKQNGTFDLMVSNPPYIPNHEKKEMESNVLDHEPAIALFVPDNDPLLFYRIISESVLPFLSKNAWIYFECHYLYVDQTREILLELGYQNVEKRKDLQGKWRMLKAQKP
jgi:release factor glutamine methyltransferase